MEINYNCPRCNNNIFKSRGWNRRKIKREFRCDKCGKTVTLTDRKVYEVVQSFPKPVKTPKILIFDIETLPLEVFCWGLYKQRISPDNVIKEWSCASWAAKWLCEPEIMSGVVTPEEAINREDKSIIKDIWKLVDEADVLVGQNSCVAPGNRVLKADFTWCNVENLKIGDKLIAFNENKPKIGKHRKYEISEVTYCEPSIGECSIIELENGKKITATNNHPWLVRFSRGHRHWVYKTTEELRIAKTQKIMTTVLDPWEEDTTYHAGYLAAFLDGEGCINQCKRVDKYKGEETIGFSFALSFSQKEVNIINKLKESLDYFNFTYNIYPYDRNHRDISRISILGGTSEVLRFLGITNSSKKGRINIDNFSMKGIEGKEDFNIKSITPIGQHKIINLTTSSSTYIVEGFPCHNCKFDVRKLNTRFLLNGLPPPMPFQSIDTLVHAKRYFSFSSYKLDYMSKLLGGERKIKTSFDLWIRCVNGDNSALLEMEKYNRQDIVATEDLYMKLRPWLKASPNMGIYVETVKTVCPNCGSNDLEWKGHYYTQAGRFNSFRCNSCTAIGRSRYADLTKEDRKELVRSIAR